MSMPQPNPQLLAFVWECSNQLKAGDAEGIRRAFSPPEDELEQPSAQQLESVYETACGLCDEDNFRFAAGIALHLATYRPEDPRFTFLAGTCMQRLGVHADAAKFFCFSLISGGDNAAALYRLGECLLAVGDRASAEKALDAAFEAARGDEDAAPLQDMARDLITASRNGLRPRHAG
jgi:tetratricopeptide (TPR) repeat protein